MLSGTILYYGTETPLPEQQQLRAGPLTAIYEQGELRTIRLEDQEIVRRLYVAVRDRNWGTIPAQLSNVTLEQGDDWFRITYLATHRQDEINFSWQGTISGNAQGTITFEMDGQAHSTFWRNRIGFCILHPIRECAGKACTIEQSDGTTLHSQFPALISPHQPFLSMQAISHEVVPGVWAEVRFQGDVFEMEDQRNWTDASFKTYCTPLSLPFPVEITQGTRVAQTVTLTLHGTLPASTRTSTETGDGTTITIGEPTARPLPRIGVQVASHGEPLSQSEIARLQALHLSHLRVDLHLSQPDYSDWLQRAVTEAQALDVPLEIALFVTDAAEEELTQLHLALATAQPRVSRWLIFHEREKSTSEHWIALARAILGDYAPEALFGAGSNAYFTEVNRQRPPVQVLDLICYSINPQVHAFDNASLVETLEAQEQTLQSTHAFAGGLPIAITPVTLKPRFNPDATGPVPPPAPGVLPPQVDVRQMSLFGACWTAGSLKYLAEGGAQSITYYETTGWRGLMERASGSPLPEQFHSIRGAVFPLYHVLADVGEYADGRIVTVQSSQPLQIDGLALHQERKTRIILANMTAQPQTAHLQFADGQSRTAEIHTLQEQNADEAMTAPLTFRSHAGTPAQIENGKLTVSLQPYSILRIDREEGAS